MNTFFKLVFGLFPLYLFSMDQETPNTNSLKGTTLRWENEERIKFSVPEYDNNNHLYFVTVIFAKNCPEPNKYSYTVTLKPIFKEKEPKEYPQFTGQNAGEVRDFVLKDIKENPKKHIVDNIKENSDLFDSLEKKYQEEIQKQKESKNN